MSKRYQVVRDKIRQSEGTFIEALRIAPVEFTCLGERRFDVAGYPHADESEALQSDWAALGQDFRVAAKIVENRHNVEGLERRQDVDRPNERDF